MITAEQIRDILSLYTKYGWKLRRVLLTESLKTKISDSLNIFDGAEIQSSDLDAVWFSRVSEKDKEAWELRRLSDTPYALFEVFDEDDEEEIREESRCEMEIKMLG